MPITGDHLSPLLRVLIFGVGNHELDFIGCLTYCLIQLYSDMKIIMDTNMKTTWHVNPVESEWNASKEAHNLTSVAARRVWEELYVCKKPAIEEVFKVSLSNSNNQVPDLLNVREQVIESATKLWLNYVDMERKSLYRMPWELHNQIQSASLKFPIGFSVPFRSFIICFFYLTENTKGDRRIDSIGKQNKSQKRRNDQSATIPNDLHRDI